MAYSDDFKYTYCPNCKKSNYWYVFKPRKCKFCQTSLKGTKTEKFEPIKEEKRKPTPINITCPYCKSTNCTKIGTVDRTMSVGLFGVGSGKLGKQWHCNSCKSNF